MGQNYHIPVLFEEAINALNIKPNGIYVDCTFGGGGHSKGILERLNNEGHLICFDQDADAIGNLPQDSRVTFIQQNFRYVQKFLRLNNITTVDGVLADLGVSSYQFNEASRGFSIRFNGPLDMRMDKRSDLTAEKIILSYSENQLHKLFEQYGEVTNSKTLAKHIVQNRSKSVVNNIESFLALLKPVVKGNPNKYFAQVFQALRIEANDELGALKEMLAQIPQMLKSSGRLAIITFHSLEDRIVKNFFKDGSFEEKLNNPFETTILQNPLKIITKKPVVPSAEEIKNNNRSRSAKLRVAEKI